MDNRYDGFTVELFLDEDEDWLAHFAEAPNISAFGESPEAALSELKTAWEAIKESYVSKGEKIPIAPSRKQFSDHSHFVTL